MLGFLEQQKTIQKQLRKLVFMAKMLGFLEQQKRYKNSEEN